MNTCSMGVIGVDSDYVLFSCTVERDLFKYQKIANSFAKRVKAGVDSMFRPMTPALAFA